MSSVATENKKSRNPFKVMIEFMHNEAFSGILLFTMALLAMVIANSDFSYTYFHWWHEPFKFIIMGYGVEMDMHHFINDALMALFFLLIGLEIKRELLMGELKGFQRAAFPVLGAIGGMAVPGLFYSIFNVWDPVAAKGFGIPMATDIAFALGVMLLLGKRVPFALKIFLVTLAVVDDLGAVLIIAFFYTKELNLDYLMIAGGVVGILTLLNLIGVRKLLPYILLGIVLWYLVYNSGVHATIAAVVFAFTIPIASKTDTETFSKEVNDKLGNFCMLDNKENKVLLSDEQVHTLEEVKESFSKVQNPLVRMEHAIHPYSAYFIMPLFAFSNAGVSVDLGAFSPNLVFLGIFVGLLVGKPLGIFGITYLFDKMNLIKKPESITWGEVVGAGMLAGMGFTMSIFITNLAFDDMALVEMSKIAILCATFASMAGGMFYLIRMSAQKSKAELEKSADEESLINEYSDENEEATPAPVKANASQ